MGTVIIGARDETQLRQNLGATGWNLTAARVARLEAASANRRQLFSDKWRLLGQRDHGSGKREEL